MQGLIGKELVVKKILQKYNVRVFLVPEDWLTKYNGNINMYNYTLSNSFRREKAIRGG